MNDGLALISLISTQELKHPTLLEAYTRYRSSHQDIITAQLAFYTTYYTNNRTSNRLLEKLIDRFTDPADTQQADTQQAILALLPTLLADMSPDPAQQTTDPLTKILMHLTKTNPNYLKLLEIMLPYYPDTPDNYITIPAHLSPTQTELKAYGPPLYAMATRDRTRDLKGLKNPLPSSITMSVKVLEKFLDAGHNILAPVTFKDSPIQDNLLALSIRTHNINILHATNISYHVTKFLLYQLNNTGDPHSAYKLLAPLPNPFIHALLTLPFQLDQVNQESAQHNYILAQNFLAKVYDILVTDPNLFPLLITPDDQTFTPASQHPDNSTPISSNHPGYSGTVDTGIPTHDQGTIVLLNLRPPQVGLKLSMNDSFQSHLARLNIIPFLNRAIEYYANNPDIQPVRPESFFPGTYDSRRVITYFAEFISSLTPEPPVLERAHPVNLSD